MHVEPGEQLGNNKPFSKTALPAQPDLVKHQLVEALEWTGTLVEGRGLVLLSFPLLQPFGTSHLLEALSLLVPTKPVKPQSGGLKVSMHVVSGDFWTMQNNLKRKKRERHKYSYIYVTSIIRSMPGKKQPKQASSNGT